VSNGRCRTCTVDDASADSPLATAVSLLDAASPRCFGFADCVLEDDVEQRSGRSLLHAVGTPGRRVRPRACSIKQLNSESYDLSCSTGRSRIFRLRVLRTIRGRLPCRLQSCFLTHRELRRTLSSSRAGPTLSDQAARDRKLLARVDAVGRRSVTACPQVKCYPCRRFASI